MFFYFIISLLCTAIGMKYFIVLLRNSQFLKREDKIDTIKKSCIKELHKNKQNTLTMGGVVMNGVLLIMSVAYYLINKEILWINLFIILYGALGFIDDYIKVKKVKDGVTARLKLVGLTLISILTVIYLIYSNEIITTIAIPFINNNFKLHIIVYSLMMILLLVVTTNSVNITDGLDGLALGISSIILIFISVVAWQSGKNDVLYSAMIILGTCLGSLIYNKYPAKIFIGDTGALFLGGAIAIFMIALNIPVWSMLVLIVCLWEMLTVIIQLASIKLTGKKVFKIAPYHHHLEKCGWKETEIVYTFWLITGVFCIISYIGVGGILF
ncbi:phospho-N-acetylmuramoyl-pentapeptide-transferase [Cellulosilyticum sp. I15G10I2]|uniref:phospho-N-acetylmuramoyl-pentapeptide- transferase n=1 Tax=Cellulosilyticum sp. I15G10I2 TaxID=1892843 RepID=UPI00085BB200|nr:phospho-N-acetylmuramoyl-pentapeptide-transferase [Cellulosilyticum sp. I15G10I2]